jgi:hypothetical protein
LIERGPAHSKLLDFGERTIDFGNNPVAFVHPQLGFDFHSV